MEQKDSAERILKQIPYEIVYSARKTLAVQVKADGSVVVRAPKRMAKYKIEAFLKEKQDWIHTPGKSVGGRRAERSEPSDGSRTKSGG